MGKVIFLNEREGGNTIMNKNINICEEVEYVRNHYGINNFPVEPALIAKELNIEIKEVGFKSHNGYAVSGGIIKNKDEFTIYVNSQDCMERKRFTIAHELGHYFLKHLEDKGQYVDLHREATYKKTEEESSADKFAACLLMPEKVLEEKYKVMDDLGFSNQAIINRLSNIFYVSNAAMRRRLKELDLI